MTPYLYRCLICGDYRSEYPMGKAPTHERCACGMRARRVIVSTYNSITALEEKGREARKAKYAEDKFALDAPAYRRLRDNHLQPRQINGCAELEGRASTQFEIEYGRVFKKEDLGKVSDGLEIAGDLKQMAKDAGMIRELDTP